MEFTVILRISRFLTLNLIKGSFGCLGLPECSSSALLIKVSIRSLQKSCIAFSTKGSSGEGIVDILLRMMSSTYIRRTVCRGTGSTFISRPRMLTTATCLQCKMHILLYNSIYTTQQRR